MTKTELKRELGRLMLLCAILKVKTVADYLAISWEAKK
jgi:hypothetical protein